MYLIYGAVLLFYISMHFLPGISLLTLNRFAVEVRWLLPQSRQKRENQENSEILNHGDESRRRTQRFLKSELRAHSIYSKYFK